MTYVMSEKKTVYLTVVNGEYLLEDLCTGVQMNKVVDYWALEEDVGEAEAAKIIQRCSQGIPEVKLAQTNKYESDFWAFNVYYLHETTKRHREIADEYVEKFIPMVYESGGDGDHFDYIPSATEEFIEYCVAIDYLEPIQRLYNSLWEGPPVKIQKISAYKRRWAPKSAYYPPQDYEPSLYAYFGVEGLVLHKDHPSS